MCVRIFTYKNFYELRTPVNTNFEKVGFCKIRDMRISAIIRIYMLAANFYRDSPMLDISFKVIYFILMIISLIL